MTTKKPHIRNPIARSPLLRKGGPHIRSKTGQRVRSRLSTYSAFDEWLEERENYKSSNKNKGSESSLCFYYYECLKKYSDRFLIT